MAYLCNLNRSGDRQTFQQPSRASVISDAVPPGSLINAIGRNAIVFNVAPTGGPAVAVVLIAELAPPDRLVYRQYFSF
jgi:hypothetical protein